MSFYIDLTSKNLITDLSSRFANIGPPAVHALVRDHSDCEVVRRHTVVLPAHHFRCHVSGRPRGLRSVIRTPVSRNTEICKSEVPVCFEHQVLWLDITMNDTTAVHCFESLHEACNEKSCLILSKSPLSCNMISQVSTKKQIHHQVQILTILERVMHVHYEPI